MAQPSPFRPAEMGLRTSEVALNQQGMSRTSSPMGPNAFDGGAASKPSVNAQPFNNARLTQQNIQQNILPASNQAQVNAVQGVRAATAQQSQAAYDAQKMAQDRIAQMLYANGEGSATMALAAMNGVEKQAFEKNIATSRVMALGLSPDLASA